MGICFADSGSDSKDSASQELPFTLTATKEETANGITVKLTFSNKTNFPILLDKQALELAAPSILFDEGLKEGSNTRISHFSQTETLSAHAPTRDQLIETSSRTIVVKPNDKFEVFIPMGNFLQSIRSQHPGKAITVRFFVPKLILEGQTAGMTGEELFHLKFSSNSVVLN